MRPAPIRASQRSLWARTCSGSVLCFLATAASGWAQPAWNVGRSGLNISEISAIAYGKGRFVIATGTGPQLASSTDGVTWTPTPSTVRSAVRNVIFTGAYFFATNATTVYASSDGINWTTRFPSVPDNPFFVGGMATDGDGVMIPFGTQTITFYDLVLNYRAPLPGTQLGGGPRQITYGAGRYFLTYNATTAAGTSINLAAATLDRGATWISSPFDPSSWIVAGGGRILAINNREIAISSDGTAFSSIPIPASQQEDFVGAPKFAGGRFLTGKRLLASTDGMSWAPLAALNAPANVSFYGIAYGNGRYIAAGGVLALNTPSNDVLAILEATGAPVFGQHPTATTVNEGQALQLSATIEGATNGTTFQWYRDGTAVPGATSATLSLPAARAADAGRYRVEARNAVGATQSSSAPVTVVPAAPAGRILNLSVLTTIDSATGADASFTVGFVVGGVGTQGTKPLLVRAAGPSLASFGVPSPHPDPRLELYAGGNKIAENDNWGGGASIGSASTAVGAFPFASGNSRDAALFQSDVARGDSSVRVFGTGGATGAVIAEIYDASSAENFTASTPRLINVSVLRSLNAGATLNAGFVLGGQTAKTILIRAVGPGLAPLGLANTFADPQLSLFRRGTAAAVASNDNWNGDPALRTAFTGVGAFSLPDGSRDAALVQTLNPGDYTAQVAGAGSGSLLLEIYEVP